MPDLNRQLIGILRDRRDVYVRLCEAFVAESFGAEWLADNKQMISQVIDGALALFVEALEGQSNDVRTFYLETLIPSIVEGGRTPEYLIAGTTRYMILMIHDAVAQLPAERRDDAVQWFANFSGGYLAELASIALRTKARVAE